MSVIIDLAARRERHAFDAFFNESFPNGQSAFTEKEIDEMFKKWRKLNQKDLSFPEDPQLELKLDHKA